MQNSLKNNYLIITASGGSGLLHAAKAQTQMIKNENPNAKIIQKDFMLDWLGKILGNFGIIAWNKAQKNGRVRFQEILVSFQPILDRLYWFPVFIKALRVLLKEDIDYVIDTQPLGTLAIIRAIRVYNKIKKKRVVLRKILVDLPTKKSTHFFNPIKKLSKINKEFIIVSTIEPLLEKNQKDKDFWEKYCSLDMSKISYDSYPVRQSFYNLQDKVRERKDYSIKIDCENLKEAAFVEDIAKKGSINMKKNETALEFQIKPDDFVITIILGSQPCFKAMLKYVNLLIEFLQKESIQKNVKMFPYCSILRHGLIKKMHSAIMTLDNYPKNLTVIPMSFQKEEVIANLYFRSDFTITRSAGQTAIELMKVSSAKFCIHTEHSKKISETTDENLLKGIPAWEAGIARYMKEKMNAILINPNSFIDVFKDSIVN